MERKEFQPDLSPAGFNKSMAILKNEVARSNPATPDFSPKGYDQAMRLLKKGRLVLIGR